MPVIRRAPSQPMRPGPPPHTLRVTTDGHQPPFPTRAVSSGRCGRRGGAAVARAGDIAARSGSCIPGGVNCTLHDCLRSPWGSSVTGAEWALAAAVVCAGLWSGLLGMLTLVMHPMLAAMDGRDFERFLQAFLPVGRKAWFNYACAIGMAVAPIVGLVTLWDDANPRPLLHSLCGRVGSGDRRRVRGVERVERAPHYDVMLAWDADAMPAEWEAGRRRYFTFN